MDELTLRWEWLDIVTMEWKLLQERTFDSQHLLDAVKFLEHTRNDGVENVLYRLWSSRYPDEEAHQLIWNGKTFLLDN